MARSKKKPSPPPSPPAPASLTPEQIEARERAAAEHARIMEVLMARVTETAQALAPTMGGRVLVDRERHRVTVAFGPCDACMVDGLASVDIEVDMARARAVMEGGSLRLVTRFSAPSAVGCRSGDDAEELGLALVSAGRFARAIVALCTQPSKAEPAEE